MFGLGLLEIVSIAVLAFIVLGPQKFPSFARDVLRVINDLKSTVFDVQKEISNFQDDIHNVVSDTQDKLLDSKKEVEAEVKKSIEDDND